MTKLTIVQLAQAAGVSPTTVSHAFSGRRYVDPDTKARIVALAQEMGYRANPTARRLRSGGGGSIALVSSMPFAVAAGPSRLGFLMEIAAAAAVTALSRNTTLCLVPPLERGSQLNALDVDGAIVVEPAFDDSVLDFFIERGVPVVAIGNAPGRPGLPAVDLRSAETARLLLDHLGDAGQRVGLVTGLQRRNSYIDTEAAYTAFCAERGFAPAAIRIDERGGEDEAAVALAAFLRENRDVGALCVPVDAFAAGALRAAAALGLSVPDDLRLATRYDGMRARLASPQLTAVNLHLDQVAETAIDMLTDLIEDKTPSVKLIATPRLVERASSGRSSE